MPLSLKILGVEQSELVRRIEGWSLRKQRGVENFSFTIANAAFSAGAYRAVVGDDVLVYDGADLIFGGRVESTTEYRAGGIFLNVQCRDWSVLTEQIVLTGSIASGPILDRAFDLYSDWLLPKGVSWIGPSTGGPTIPDMTFTRSTLADVLNKMGKYVNYLWRINGLREFGFWTPGALPFPKNPLLGEDFLLGTVNIDQTYYDRATRLFLITGGEGEFTHTETHVADGSKAYFLLTVEPKAPTEEDGVVTSYLPTQVTVNGVTHPLDGSPWFYDAVNHAVWNLNEAVPAGQHVVVSYQVARPATVRVWEPSLLTSVGQIDVGFLVDKIINIGHISDVNEAKLWGDTEILSRAGSPRKLKGTTLIKGWYPGLTGGVFMPPHNVNANFLVETVNIRDVGADGRKTQFLFYDLEMIEGDTPGRQWQDVYREALGSGGGASSSGGGGGGGTTPGEGTVGYPPGHTMQLGGDNRNPYPANTTFVDIPEMLPNKFGGEGMEGDWTFQAYGVLLEPIGSTLQIELLAGGSQIAVATINTVGQLLGSLPAATPITVSAPVAPVDLLCRYRVTSGTNTVVIGHCVLQKV